MNSLLATDRRNFSLCAGLIFVAFLRLLGEQGVSIGDLVFPEIRLYWLGLFAAITFLVAPQSRAPFPSIRWAVAILALTLTAWPLTEWRAEISKPKPELAAAVFRMSRMDSGPRRTLSFDSLHIGDRDDLHRLVGRRGGVALNISGFMFVPRAGKHRFYLSADDRASLDIDGGTVIESASRGQAEVSLEQGVFAFSVRYEQTEGPASLGLAWNCPGLLDILPLDHYIDTQKNRLTPEFVHRKELSALTSLFLSSLWWVVASLVLVRTAAARRIWLHRMDFSTTLPRLVRAIKEFVDRPWARVFVLSLLGLFGGWMVLQGGSRGFFALDQSIVFDGGYRLFLGQVPYKDFSIPVGPVSFWIQWLFFNMLSVDYFSYLAHAATVNVLALIMAYAWVKILYPASRVLAYVAALLTAVWFYPPFGTPWMDQTAYFFHLLASMLACKACNPSWSSTSASERQPFSIWLTAGAAGLATALSFLSKQNGGSLTVVSCLVVLFVGSRAPLKWRTSLCSAYIAGLLLGTSAFAVWLFLVSDPGIFYEHFLEIPSAEGVRRLTRVDFSNSLIREFSFAGAHRAVGLVALVLGVSGLTIGAKVKRGPAASSSGKRQSLVSATLLTLSLYQLLFICLTNNDPYNGYPFTGLLFVLALLFVDDVERSSRKSFGETVNRLSTPKSSAVLRLSLVLVALVAGAHLLQEGWRFTFSRVVHDTLDDADYSPAVYSHALRPVQWGIPTMASWRKRQEVTAQSVDDLSAYLKQMEGDFFIFPDFTVLYGISGKTPPQPLLWFHRGLTYPMVYSESLDARIIESLKKNQIECVVLETESYLGTQNRLGDFPLLREYIESWFVPTRRIGIFQILRRRNQDERGESSWSPSWQRNPAACETSIRSTRTTRSRMSVAPRIQFLGAPSSGAQTDNRQCLKARGDPEEISIW